MDRELKIPNHVAIIMDGNGRWATKRFMPRVMGHRKGVEAIKSITIKAHQLGIKILTLYAFSTENWARPKEEVNYLMNLPKDFFTDFLPQIMENNVKVQVMGDIAGLPESTHDILNKVLDQTKDNTGLILNFAINYGSQQEITQAVKNIAKEVQLGVLDSEAIDENLIADHLETSRYGDLANPDLLIRTSGELRLSNFLLWQLAYSEFYFTDILWPDFDGQALEEAVLAYTQRDRRFGRLK
ncbi:isoprenyl transferase [Hutsoniella sourekii]|uniref:isoprenyl transferase n=1 Tax=Hutsoniella sourekii TaxID=87650 RepID=UPI000482EBD6|nr:isoprenyl transferase [Hutsoniella sourekii]